jgi:cytochrome c-type biogenesis protein CcmH/NrfG
MIVLRLAQVYERCSRAADTIALLDRHPIEPWANGDADIALAHAHADLGDADGMRAAVDRLRGAAHGSGARIADTLILLGTLEHQLHNDGHAMRAFDEAARLAPESAGMAEVAALAESLGDRTRAYQAYSQVCHRDGPASPACAAASRLRGD